MRRVLDARKKYLTLYVPIFQFSFAIRSLDQLRSIWKRMISMADFCLRYIKASRLNFLPRQVEDRVLKDDIGPRLYKEVTQDLVMFGKARN